MTKSIESHVKSIESLVSAKFFQGNIKGIIIGTTGDSPFRKDDIDNLIEKLGGIADQNISRGQQKYIVIGRECYNEAYLSNVVDQKGDMVFLSQEQFVNYLLFGVETNNPYDKKEINNHPGLSYIDNLGGFPSGDDLLSPFACAGSGHTSSWKDKSFLREKYHYHTGMLYPQRKECLTAAVREEGLYPVVSHISWLVRLNTRKGNIKDAVNVWVRDLDWLKYTYHGRDGNDFVWPEY